PGLASEQELPAVGADGSGKHERTESRNEPPVVARLECLPDLPEVHMPDGEVRKERADGQPAPHERGTARDAPGDQLSAEASPSDCSAAASSASSRPIREAIDEASGSLSSPALMSSAARRPS